MTLQEVIEAIEHSKIVRDIFHETSPENSAIISEKCNGKFEAVLTGKGTQKALIPGDSTLFFLYRGQNQEYIPCVPSIYRNNPSEVDIFINRMRLVVFESLIESHPVVAHFFRKHDFVVDIEGLAQHYGLNTSVLDLSSNLDIALFFAVCKYDNKSDSYDFYDDDESHEGVLYVFDPLFDNEPCFQFPLEKFLSRNIRPIGLQPFLRPAEQEGYALHIKRGGSIKAWMYRFTFTSSDSKFYYDKFQQGEKLWIKDELIRKTKEILKLSEFSYNTFDRAYNQYKPKGFSKTQMKRMLDNVGILLSKKIECISFSKTEYIDIVREWNNKKGQIMADKIVRKPWLEYEGIDKTTKKVQGICNKQDYRSLPYMSFRQSVMLLASFASDDKFNGAKWVNYTRTPAPHRKVSNDHLNVLKYHHLWRISLESII